MTTWYVNAGTGGDDSGSSWANAAESISGLMAAQVIAGGDIIKVHKTHSYLAGATITWTLPETGNGLVKVLCVDKDASDALSSGAVESTNGAFAFTINSSANADSALFVHGMTIKSGAGGSVSAADINISQQGGYTFQNCIFFIHSTNSLAQLGIGITSGGSSSFTKFDNCSFRFGTTGTSIALRSGRLEFIGCSIDTTDSTLTTLFVPDSSAKGYVESHSCDWSGCTNLVNMATGQASIDLLFINCVIPTPTIGTHWGRSGTTVECRMCAPVDGTNGADILSYFYENAYGTVEDEQSVVFASGSSQGEQDDGTDTSYSLKMTPTSRVGPCEPLYTPWINRMVTSTGAKSITLKVAHTESAVLKENEIWMEVEYMGEPGLTGTQRVANSPHAQLELDDDVVLAPSSLCIDPLAAGDNRTDTAEAVNNITGEKTHTLTASVTLDEVGPIRCRIALAKDTTNPVYVNAKIGIA